MTRFPSHRIATLAALTVLALSSSAHATVAYTYDDLGRVTSITYDDGIRITYTYDAAGNRTQHVIGIVPNQLPSAVNDSVTAIPTVPLTIDVRANDSDPDNDALTL